MFLICLVNQLIVPMDEMLVKSLIRSPKKLSYFVRESLVIVRLLSASV
ncbi:hypothetical protein PORCRE_1971 [Porphyromonas crevioricanis JCM 15906]|uniref:Uncharacterized protein n=1 Tax=Porphyromonas crevioricanis JCM 15906 TaxID=1305617 RepID=T1CR04_9PORP|nr:hypothetical protein PORCRE_1971 [Porphyromonas crevioricanis JCM 15906]GAD06779.1 hypothetical protein PORCAN_387 [Porphyromonas crevioricanis JCM 13913]